MTILVEECFEEEKDESDEDSSSEEDESTEVGQYYLYSTFTICYEKRY